MNFVKSFEIENERFYFYDIKTVIEKNKKLKKLPIVLKILLEASLRKSKDNIELEKIINTFSNRIDSKIEFQASRIALNEEEIFPILVNLASFREVNKNINPEVLIDITLNCKSNKINKEQKSFLKWASKSFSNIRLSFSHNDGFKSINLETLSTILHIEKKDEKFYLYPETILGKNSFGVLNLKLNEIELNRAILGKKVINDLPKVIGINIENDLEEDEIFYNIFDSLIIELKKHNFENKIVEFYGSGLKNLNMEERTAILNMASSFNAISFYFPIDKETIEYFNITRESEDFGHLIQKYYEIQGIFYNQDEELEYDEKIKIKISSLEKSFKIQNVEYVSFFKMSENIFKEDESWQNINFEQSEKYKWNDKSIFLQPLNIFEPLNLEKIELNNASILALFEGFISIEDISSLGQISLYSPSAKYLESKGIKSFEYGTYQERITNSQVMLRALFDSKDIHNQMVSKEGGFTIDYKTNEIVPIFKMAYRFEQEKKDFVIFAGENYGVGKSQDWAAKGMRVLGVKAIIAKSIAEAYRIDLIKYGVLPLEFVDDDIETLKLKGKEQITILSDEIKPDCKLEALIKKDDLKIQIELKCRLDSYEEVEFYKRGGLFSYLLNEKNL